ncbi:MAG: ABC transporter substrate-binding protein [Dehalococcoidales bacterium]|nr:ABC transporter substrate-binding protein [Dehalococcoidales bacterium]
MNHLGKKLYLVVALIAVMAILFPACAKEVGMVEVLGVWGADELASFEAMVAPWEEDTGNTMEFTGTRDLIAILTTRIEAGNPPDIAILPNPGQMAELAKDGDLVALDSFLDMNKIEDEYAQGWIDLGMVNSKLYGIFMKASSKGTVWYNPKTFAANTWDVPTTWDEMIALSDQIVAQGKNPWSVAIESGEASGWPATDWIGEILLHESGGAVYDQWVNHEIPWTDSRIKSAWEKFGQIVLTPDYVPGGAITALATNFVDGSYLPYEDPPKAAMYYLGAFTQGFIAEQFPELAADEDYAFFPFPAIASQYAGAVTGGADVVVVFNDNEITRSFIEYLASAEAQQIWVERGGFTSANSKVSLNAYPDELARAAAEQLTGATIFRFDADDNMPSAVQKAFWTGTLEYLQHPDQLEEILADIETVAVGAYE